MCSVRSSVFTISWRRDCFIEDDHEIGVVRADLIAKSSLFDCDRHFRVHAESRRIPYSIFKCEADELRLQLTLGGPFSQFDRSIYCSKTAQVGVTKIPKRNNRQGVGADSDFMLQNKSALNKNIRGIAII